jgi:hypothetical protein
MKKLILIFALVFSSVFFTAEAASQTGVQQVNGIQFGGDSSITGTTLLVFPNMSTFYSVGYQVSVFCSAELRVITGNTFDTTIGTYVVVPAGVPFNSGYYKPLQNKNVWIMLNNPADTATVYPFIRGN